MPSPRLVAFLEELQAPMERQQAAAEALILRVPGEGQANLPANEENELLQEVAAEIMGPVQAWVRAVQDLADAERAWGPSENARRAGRDFAQATDEFLAVWARLLEVQPATEPMRHVLALVHAGFYEYFLSGPRELWRSGQDIVAGKAEARLTFEPQAPSLRDASSELRRLRARQR